MDNIKGDFRIRFLNFQLLNDLHWTSAQTCQKAKLNQTDVRVLIVFQSQSVDCFSKSHRTFKLLNFRTFKLSNFQTFKLSNFRTFKLSNFQAFKLSSFQIFELSKSKCWLFFKVTSNFRQKSSAQVEKQSYIKPTSKCPGSDPKLP